jgi:hypothetical protein
VSAVYTNAFVYALESSIDPDSPGCREDIRTASQWDPIARISEDLEAGGDGISIVPYQVEKPGWLGPATTLKLCSAEPIVEERVRPLFQQYADEIRNLAPKIQNKHYRALAQLSPAFAIMTAIAHQVDPHNVFKVFEGLEDKRLPKSSRGHDLEVLRESMNLWASDPYDPDIHAEVLALLKNHQEFGITEEDIRLVGRKGPFQVQLAYEVVLTPALAPIQEALVKNFRGKPIKETARTKEVIGKYEHLVTSDICSSRTTYKPTKAILSHQLGKQEWGLNQFTQREP